MRRRRTRKRQPIGKKGLAHTDTRIFPIAAAGICLFSLSVGAAFLGGGGRSFLAGGPAGQGREAVQETEAALLGKSFYERELVMAPEDYANVAISQVTDYVNIRQEATTASPVVGKLYNNCAATILGPVNGQGGVWYQIRSGTVSGYVKAQYFITGAQAEAIAKNVGTEYATINTSALRLRSEPNLTSEVLTTLKQGTEYVVLEEKDGFARLSVDADMEGYVSMDYIKIRVDFKQAVSLEEEETAGSSGGHPEMAGCQDGGGEGGQHRRIIRPERHAGRRQRPGRRTRSGGGRRGLWGAFGPSDQPDRRGRGRSGRQQPDHSSQPGKGGR